MPRLTRRQALVAAAAIFVLAQAVLYVCRARFAGSSAAAGAKSGRPVIVHNRPPPLAGHGVHRELISALFPARKPTKCSEMAVPDTYWQTKDAFTPPFVHIPNRDGIQIGQTVCVRVVVPAPEQRSSITYTPLVGMPWDSVLLDMVGSATNISVPVKLTAIADYRNTIRDSPHVYEADVLLRDVDMFVPRGYVEFRDAQWNPEAGLPPVAYDPEALFIADELAVEVGDADGSSPFSLKRHLDLPLCTEPDAEGRWVSGEALPFSAGEVPPADNHNMVWLPYSCRLRRISYADAVGCMTARHPLMHWYGDSNIRRTLKKIATLGQWCSTAASLQTRACLCEDYTEANFTRFNAGYRELMIDVTSEGGQALTTPPADYRDVPDGTARIYLHKWEGLTHRNQPHWRTEFEKGITARYGHPSIAVISLTNWDAAFSSRVDFAVQMELLMDHLAHEYTPATKFVIRTGQYYCCRTDATPGAPRSFSRLRNAYFNDYVLRAFRERFGATHKVAVWDVAGLTERLPFSTRKEAVTCPANHARAEVVEIENQILFNAMCNIAPLAGASQKAPSAGAIA
ncbi:hypothetical protein IWQ56_002979 [Coemansia nantahalensis]|uniref:Uncharacterized protein n=1 Tax=Coemansia nantahalensis TaxID=2789366 RepID=A0ACC1JVJ9_9FUNG|nr:hypothetical protein IWQ57_003599 [Coemansia nantahalensis]KAJ2768325.1 hypothetical protein IWQ56_002979 [Coemansia nantahalensis]